MRNNKAPVLLIVAAFAAFAASAQPGNDSAEKQVMAAETARVTALDHSDLATLDRLLADDLTYVHASGRVDTKASFLDAISNGQLHYISWEPLHLHVRVAGSMAVIDGEYAVHVSDLRVQPSPFQVNVFILTVYALRDGHWRQIAWQSTRDVATSPSK